MRGRPTGIPGPARGGEKKWVPPGGPGQAWLRPASAGKKNGFPRSGNPFSPAPMLILFPRGKWIHIRNQLWAERNSALGIADSAMPRADLGTESAQNLPRYVGIFCP